MKQEIAGVEKRSGTETQLIQYFALMLRVPVSQVRTDISVLELGADSIMLVEAQRWLREKFNCDIEVRKFFDDLNSIGAIAAYLDQQELQSSTSESEAFIPTSDGPLPKHDTELSARLSAADYLLLQSQLKLTFEVIDKQNNFLASRGVGMGAERQNMTRDGR